MEKIVQEFFGGQKFSHLRPIILFNFKLYSTVKSILRPCNFCVFDVSISLKSNSYRVVQNKLRTFVGLMRPKEFLNDPKNTLN